MSLTKEVYQAYCDILKEELRLAMGCTEPIAIAYSASIARSYLTAEPTEILIGLSGNIIKNVKACLKCGENNSQDNIFCSKCGSKLDD